MKIHSAGFENFRILRDLELDFSIDKEKNLTVIRAENETGKTTILTALQWAFYGDDALPNKGELYRLHPIDWDIEKDGKHVEIAVSVEFETIHYRSGKNKEYENKKKYRLIRSTSEKIEGNSFKRISSTVKLFAINDVGSPPVNEPDSFIREELPAELREVFFTDGDRALSFIEADTSTARKRVKSAIRSLLGLGIIDSARQHVKKSEIEVHGRIRKNGQNTELSNITKRIEELNENIIEHGENIKDCKTQYVNYQKYIKQIDTKIAETLKKGDREKLANELNNQTTALDRIENRINKTKREHSALFEHPSLGRNLLKDTLSQAFGILDKLHDERQIPNQTIPVLEDRLSLSQCICGESLDPNSSDGRTRRENIQKLIDENAANDELKGILNDLFYDDSVVKPNEQNEYEWIGLFSSIFSKKDEEEQDREIAAKKLRSLEIQIKELPDTDIQELRESKEEYRDKRDEILKRQTINETHLERKTLEVKNLEKEQDQYLKKQKEGEKLRSEFTVIRDALKILDNSYERITTEEVGKVSDYMNAIFIEMIGADPTQGAIIKRAEVNRDFDIMVYGPKGRTLDPDIDLNGASRRALTVAFILALTNVSGVEAPNVIDTPLGMMSGYVKTKVLETAVRESSQLILFLTHAEINGCEEVIDEYAGQVVTLSNPAHYPKILVNKPEIDIMNIIQCNCNHREECKICQRKYDTEDLQVNGEI